MRKTRGFTLLELMVVVAIVALATAGVSFALRDDGASRLDREALRLSALLEAARAQSRASGLPVVWRLRSDGFEFIGLPGVSRDAQRPSTTAAGTATGTPARLQGPLRWLDPGLQAQVTQPPGADTLLLGPEPLIPRQRIALALGERQLELATDGIGPFAVVATGATP